MPALATLGAPMTGNRRNPAKPGRSMCRNDSKKAVVRIVFDESTIK